MLASILAALSAVIIDCSYEFRYNGYGLGFIYLCEATISTLDHNEAITAVINTDGTADPALQTSDVEWFNLANPINLRVFHFPSNMAKIFPKFLELAG